MTSLAARVLAGIRRRSLIRPGARIVAAVSGGADSVALAWLLRELSTAGALDLAGIAHLDHSLRGAESARDAAFCRDLAAELGVTFDVEASDVNRLARESGSTVEEAGREARYAFFERARARASADVVATAHTRDDQAETVLLRLFRGAGTRGLGGIPPVRGAIVRPLIDVHRRDLVAWLQAHRRAWVEDSTNADRTITRNWIRHELLPLVTGRFGDGAVDALARSADFARADDAVLSETAQRAAAGIQTAGDSGVELLVAPLVEQPAAIRQRIIRAAFRRVTGRSPAAAHVAAILRMAELGTPARQAVGASQLELSDGGRVLSIRGVGPGRQEGLSAWSYTLPVPGNVDVPEARGRLTAESTSLDRVGGFAGIRKLPPGKVAVGGVGTPLIVRGWSAGDALQVLGSSGRKKVQDLFVDRKVPREHRRKVPIVTLPDGSIVWVAGHALGEAFRVTEATKSVVVLSFEPVLEATK